MALISSGRPLLLLALLLFGSLGVPAAIAADDPGRLTFLVLGDQGSGDVNQSRVAAAMERVAGRGGGVDFVLLLGDNFYGLGPGPLSDRQWHNLFEGVYTGPVLGQTPFYAIPGNHDHKGDLQEQVDYTGRGSGRWRMPARHYSHDFGRAGQRPLLRLVALDTGGDDTALARQVTLLRRAFGGAAVDGPVWKVVAGHHPLRSMGPHPVRRKVRSWFRSLAELLGVDVWFAGHDHNLQIIQPASGPLHVVSGGGGQGLYDLSREDPDARFAAVSHGFMQVTADTGRLTVEVFDDQARSLHVTSLAR